MANSIPELAPETNFDDRTAILKDMYAAHKDLIYAKWQHIPEGYHLSVGFFPSGETKIEYTKNGTSSRGWWTQLTGVCLTPELDPEELCLYAIETRIEGEAYGYASAGG